MRNKGAATINKVSGADLKKRIAITSKYEKVGDKKFLIKKLLIKGREFVGEFDNFFFDVPLYLLSDVKLREIPKGVVIETGLIEYEEHKEEYEEILKNIPYCDTFEISRNSVSAHIEVSSLDYSHITPIIAKAVREEALRHNFSVLEGGMLGEIIIEQSDIDPNLTVLEAISSIMIPIIRVIEKIQEGRKDSIVNMRYKKYEPPNLPIVEEPYISISSKLELPLEALADYHRKLEASRLGAYLSSGKGFIGLGKCDGNEYPLVTFWSYEKGMIEDVAALLDENIEFVKLKEIIRDMEVFTEWKGVHIFLGPVEREEFVYCVRVRGEKALRLLSIVYQYIVGIKQNFADILLRRTWH